MPGDENADDIPAIKALIARQFASLSWTESRPANWDEFAADFHPEASLYPSARPVKRQTIEGFLERMKGLAGATLPSLEEAMLGADIKVFGNVAVAIAACELVENHRQVNRNVEMLLLVKDAGAWRIVAQAWDGERPERPIPVHLRGRKDT